jgi:serine/threonine protein kinase
MELTQDSLLHNRYVIKEQLGKGGMGAVYLAYDTALDTNVAVKSNLAPGEDSERQFLREARLLAGLRHTNLPRVTDYFVIGDVQYLVMDFIPGDDLSLVLSDSGPQPLERVLDWTTQLGDALNYIHSQDPPVIHRDIKPDNVKLTPEGSIILVDFGIAKASASGQTTTGARAYTPGFAPAEQYGGGRTGPYSDQYSLAATIYKLLTGDAPADSIERMMGQTQLIPPCDLNPSIPANVDSAIMRALRLNPQDRFTRVLDFINALHDPDYKDNAAPTITARPISEPAQTQLVKTQHAPPDTLRDPRRKPPPTWLKAIPVVILIGVIVVMLGAVGISWVINNFGSDDTSTSTQVVFNPSNTPEIILPTVTQTATLPPPATPSNTPMPIPSDTATPPPTPTDTNTPMPEPTQVGSGGVIAFVSNRGDGRSFQIFTMLPDGSEVTQVTFDPINKSQPQWSPDGTRLLFVADGGGRLGLDIWILNADGSDPENLTQSEGDDFHPAWSPDGSKIAFTSTRRQGFRFLHTMNTDGSDQRIFTGGLYPVEYAPTWSPDGQWIAFVTSINDAPGKLYLRPSGGGEAREFDRGDRLGIVERPAWSPDGAFIVYENIMDRKNEIYLAVFEDRGTDISALTDSLGNNEPSWSPDSLWIVFTSTRDQNHEIYIMTSVGLLQTNLTNHIAEDKEPNWQPSLLP